MYLHEAMATGQEFKLPYQNPWMRVKGVEIVFDYFGCEKVFELRPHHVTYPNWIVKPKEITKKDIEEAYCAGCLKIERQYHIYPGAHEEDARLYVGVICYWLFQIIIYVFSGYGIVHFINKYW